MFCLSDVFAFQTETVGDLPDLIERILALSKRPRYAFMVLNLICRVAGKGDSVVPYVRKGTAMVLVRDWPCEALIPLAHRDGRRLRAAGPCAYSAGQVIGSKANGNSEAGSVILCPDFGVLRRFRQRDLIQDDRSERAAGSAYDLGWDTPHRSRPLG